MWDFVWSTVLEYAAGILMDAFRFSPLYPEEWSLMRFINAFLLVCAAAFLIASGMLGWLPFWIAAGILLACCVTRLLAGKMME